MAERNPTIHICDDWISITLPDRKSIISAQIALSAGNFWTEIVPGLNNIAIQFDPAFISPDDAAQKALDQLTKRTRISENSGSIITIPVCYETEFAPDREYVAKKLGIGAEALPSWHIAQNFDVAMLGFMPGFAYLESVAECPAIGRLASPRQLVAAGSIGIIGSQSCIYSFDSPGGWPIIGRTPLNLFEPTRSPPALLAAGQRVNFEAISKNRFERWHKAPAT
ncbi:5-oxoprolinase subunit B family protein [Parasphingorhabdus sp.]|uniref:5-oxoprolinase subunit B family protein n=1 Tax=Parasphingorhabdus sp. TaxID=2709688 RepID=UPI003A8F0942